MISLVIFKFSHTSTYSNDLSLKDARHAFNLAARSGATMRGVELASGYMTPVNWRVFMVLFVRRRG